MEQRVRKPEVRTGKLWKCDQCLSTFQRLDHMKRHILTHHTPRGYLCSFCSSAFSRGDVLRRHWKSCKARLESGQEIPKPERGGKHKRACDSCASLRKACSGELPCAECTQREKQCTYQRLLQDEPPFPPASRGPTENQNAKISAVDDDTPKGSEHNWDLGPATLYPPAVAAFARRHSIALDSSGRPVEI